ncbi:hypothetical protein CY0110_29119 [Crocosphaera chwakensis CCY0110]|uniref:Uncharacterized protein n=1 Tax=Crocosphaera chwakensis CCY0110 TaxID=391612 RepID=A3IUR8_9CHRO|nr:hypothetical protein CY0110_29119 [Crocosphaera chwakensis CCY0110]
MKQGDKEDFDGKNLQCLPPLPSLPSLLKLEIFATQLGNAMRRVGRACHCEVKYVIKTQADHKT